MTAWRRIKFSEICDISRGGSPRPIHEYLCGEGTPWVKIADATESNSRYIDATKECIRVEGEAKSQVVYPGDFILSNSATPGLPRFMRIRACIHDGWLLLREFKDADPLFLYYALLTQREALLAQGNGSIFTNLKTEILKNHEICLPPLCEQKAIAAILTNLDDKIDLLHRQNKTLEAMAETLFRQWFVEETKDDWQEKTLRELVTITRGASPRPIVQFIENGTVPWIKISDATGGSSFFIDATREFILEEGVSKSVKVLPGDLIMSNSATCGLPYFVDIEGCIHDGWLLFKGFDVLSNYFVFFFLKCIYRELMSSADGSVQDNLNTGILKEFPIRIPPSSRLREFDNFAGEVVAKVRSNSRQIRTLESLRDSLLPKLMSGEVRVRYESEAA